MHTTGIKHSAIAFCASAVVASCGPTEFSPEAYELANIQPWHIVPRSSPRQLTRALGRYCLADTPQAARTALRRDGYVKVPNASGPIETFLIDTRSPAVQLHTDGPCAITAEARTGQSNGVADYVVDAYPDAQKVSLSDPSVEGAWVDPDTGLAITTVRRGHITEPSRLTVLVQRVN